MKRLLFTLITVLASTGCAAFATNPTEPQRTSLRAQAGALTDDLTVAVGLVDEIGFVVAGTALSVADKDAIDCAIKKALGDDAPSAVVTRICGAILSRIEAPLRKAVRTLHQLTTEPSIKNTIQVALEILQPLWERLERSSNTRLALLGSILRLTLKPATVAAGGGA